MHAIGPEYNGVFAIMFRPFGFIAPKTLLNYLAFQSFDFELPDEGYSRSALCALNFISTFLFCKF